MYDKLYVMNILFLLDKFLPVQTAGAVRVDSFVRQLSQTHEITIVAGSDVSAYEQSRVRIISTQFRSIFSIIYFLFSAIREIARSSVVVISVPMYELLVFTIFVRLLGKRLVVDFRDSVSFVDYESILQRFFPMYIAIQLGKLARLFSKKLAKYSLTHAQLITVANTIIEQEVKFLKPALSNTSVVLIPNGVSDAVLKIAPVSRLKNETITFGYVGNFSERDRFEPVIQLLQKYSNTRLLLIGDGRNKSKVLANLRETVSGKRVIDKGRLDHEQVPKILSKEVDVVLMFRDVSTTASIPVSVIESAALGIPVMVNDVGTMAEFVRQEKIGLVITDDIDEQYIERWLYTVHALPTKLVNAFRAKYDRTLLAQIFAHQLLKACSE